MNYLIYSDFHITKESLEECSLIFNEITEIGKVNNVDRYINLGDTFDVIKPSSEELDLFAQFIIKSGKGHTIIAAKSHESTSAEDSILNHFGILLEHVNIVQDYTDSGNYFGHFYVKESKKGKFGATVSKEELKKYKHVYLGHQHSFEIIPKNICQLGSVRYVNFDEAIDQNKKVALVTDFGDNEKEKFSFINLKSPYPMKQIEVTNVPETIKILNELSEKTKVKVLINSFEVFKEWLPNEYIYKTKFTKFIRENKFEIKYDTKLTVQGKAFKESLLSWIEKQKLDKNVKEALIKEL